MHRVLVPKEVLTSLRAEIFVVDWFETCKFRGINFGDSAIYLKVCGINFRGFLERSQNQAIGGKIYEKCRIFAFELLTKISKVTCSTHFSYLLMV